MTNAESGGATAGMLVLVVEDEPQMRRFLRPALEGQGYRVIEAATAKEAIVLASTHNPDCVILDLGLPDGDGAEVTRRLREWSTVPIIVVSARGQEADKVAALDAGADDYLTKPFGTGELLARLRVAQRHIARFSDGSPEPVFEALGLRVDLGAREVRRDGEEVHLTPLEYKLLATLVRHYGKVLTHRQLLKEVWGPSAVAETQYLRVYMAQLRHKIEKDPARPVLIMTETGVGYRLRAPGTEALEP
jgi:two-component system, OmpR family, KDP operon response regulator KdpE